MVIYKINEFLIGFIPMIFKCIIKTLRRILLTAVFASITSIPSAFALSDKEIISGFNLTVFGSEITPFAFQARYIRKFNDEVRFRIHNFSTKDRSREVANFINSLEKDISGLQVRIIDEGESANFDIYIVNRSDYKKTVRAKVEKNNTARVPGKCLVKSRFTRKNILRSDAVIVSDEGEALFKRCLIEEVLQGLGPLNESTSLDKSVFNDTSKHTKFTMFDRIILNMLYDERIKNGASKRTVSKILKEVLADTRKRLGR